VWNKIDVSGMEPGVDRDEYGRISRIRVSARTGAGLQALRGAIAEIAREDDAPDRNRTDKPEFSP
jgi:GTP-binding protein HflX